MIAALFNIAIVPMTPFRPRRTALYVPGSNERALKKAAVLDADVLILDLEDAVAPSEKVAARQRVVAALAEFRSAGLAAECVVRINGLDSLWGKADLAAVVPVAPDGILLPKVSSPGDLTDVRAAAIALGPLPSRGLPLWAMIETPRAVLDPLAIATAQDERMPLVALVLGLNDLARETRARQIPGRAPMMPWIMAALAAARAGGIDILDAVYNDIADVDGFQAECRMGRDCGFDGKTVIHPSQIAPCNAVFAPDAAELAWAEKIAGLFERPEHANAGVVMVEGRMVERLHAEIAARTLAITAAITRR